MPNDAEDVPPSLRPGDLLVNVRLKRTSSWPMLLPTLRMHKVPYTLLPSFLVYTYNLSKSTYQSSAIRHGVPLTYRLYSAIINIS